MITRTCLLPVQIRSWQSSGRYDRQLAELIAGWKEMFAIVQETAISR